MNICMLGFPLGKVGGVLTFVENIKLGFEILGHNVDCYAITTNKKKKPDNNDYGFENVLGFENEEWFNEYKNVVSRYDTIIFIHQSPHLLKSYNRENWKKCYEIISGKNVLAWVHDAYYEKYYPWFNDIPLKYNVKIVCPYSHMYNSIKNLRAMKVKIDNPFYIENSGLYSEEKENIIVDHNNWKSVKHKELLLEYCDKIESKIISFGDENSFDFRKIKEHKNFNLIIHKGWQNKNVIYKYLKRAKVFTDFFKLSKCRYVWDYTITEAIAYGCIPVMQSFPDKKINYFKINSYSEIPCIINSLCKSFKEKDDIRLENLEIIKNITPVKIVKQIIEYINLPYKETKSHTWW